jgi:hypothetical protein
MHYRLYVLTDKSNANNSKEARDYVNDQLLNDSSFVGEGGRFSSPIADWFVIGGRWSGVLTQIQLNQSTLKRFWDEFEAKKLGWTSKENSAEDQAKKTHKLFKSYFPKFKGLVPVYRGDDIQYNRFENGADDDAMLVTKKLWKIIKENFKKEYERELPEYPEVEEDYIVDLEGEPLTDNSVIGKKWIVVVDFHN